MIYDDFKVNLQALQRRNITIKLPGVHFNTTLAWEEDCTADCLDIDMASIKLTNATSKALLGSWHETFKIHGVSCGLFDFLSGRVYESKELAAYNQQITDFINESPSEFFDRYDDEQNDVDEQTHLKPACRHCGSTSGNVKEAFVQAGK